LQVVPIQPPAFDFAPFSKRMFAAWFFSRLSHRSNQGSYGCVKG